MDRPVSLKKANGQIIVREWKSYEIKNFERRNGRELAPSMLASEHLTDDLFTPERVMCKVHLQEWYATSNWDKLVPNEHSFPGTPMFERFTKALEAASDKRVALVFHGTPRVNIDSILTAGFKVELNKENWYGIGNYFTTVIGEAAQYTFAASQRKNAGYVASCWNDPKQLILVAVIVDDVTRVYENDTVIAIKDDASCLPIFTFWA
jgi:hypothetical protein